MSPPRPFLQKNAAKPLEHHKLATATKLTILDAHVAHRLPLPMTATAIHFRNMDMVFGSSSSSNVMTEYLSFSGFDFSISACPVAGGERSGLPIGPEVRGVSSLGRSWLSDMKVAKLDCRRAQARLKLEAEFKSECLLNDVLALRSKCFYGLSEVGRQKTWLNKCPAIISFSRTKEVSKWDIL